MLEQNKVTINNYIKTNDPKLKEAIEDALSFSEISKETAQEAFATISSIYNTKQIPVNNINKSNNSNDEGPSSSLKSNETNNLQQVSNSEIAPISTQQPETQVEQQEQTDNIPQQPLSNSEIAPIITTQQPEPQVEQQEQTDNIPQQPNGEACPSEGKEPTCEADKQREERLLFHPDKNLGCKDEATEKFKFLNNKCSDQYDQSQQPESQQPESQQTYDQAQQPESQHDAPNDTKQNQQLPISATGVTTSTTTTPKDGYNEVHIVVRIPEKYGKVMTGSASSTADATLVGMLPTKGGSNIKIIKKNSNVTPKNKRKQQSTLLRRKTMPKRRRK